MRLQFGPTSYQLFAREQSGSFLAYACRGDSEERYGIETVGTSAADAISKLTRWLEWQHQHTDALERLQDAERGYHRKMASAAFADDRTGVDTARKQALETMTAARNHLDDVRARRPNV